MSNIPAKPYRGSKDMRNKSFLIQYTRLKRKVWHIKPAVFLLILYRMIETEDSFSIASMLLFVKNWNSS